MELEAVTRRGSKANPVLVAGRIVGVDGQKGGGEVGVTASLLARSLLQDGVVGPEAAVRLLQSSGSLWARPESVTQGDWWEILCTDLVQGSVVSTMV